MVSCIYGFINGFQTLVNILGNDVRMFSMVYTDTMLGKILDLYFYFRARGIVKHLAPFIDPLDKVLDFGCGNMTIARQVSVATGAYVSGVDVIDLNRTEMEMFIYDGEMLPFDDERFGVTYAAFVLHHTANIPRLLCECLRVSKNRLILLEDVYKGRLELAFVKVRDWLGNIFVSKEMSMPFNFMGEEEWLALFATLGIEQVTTKKVTPMGRFLTKHRMFILELGKSKSQ